MTTLPTECQSTLEALLADDELADDARKHLGECASCETLASEMVRDQKKLREALAAIPIPPPPAVPLPDGLHSASGYPRRTSLTLMPFFLLIILTLCLGAVALTLYTLDRLKKEATEQQLVQDLDQLSRSVRRARDQGLAATPDEWLRDLRGLGLLDGLTVDDQDGRLQVLDPYSRAYRLAEIEGVWTVYSVGPNGVDEQGGGDDVGRPISGD